MTANEPQPASQPQKPRWYRLTPDRLVVGLLAAEGFLLLSEWLDRFPFNRQTWTVLIALAAVGLTLLLMFLWFLAALVFHWRFQYSLRSLMLMVVVVAILCSWLATEMQWERKQREAAEAIWKAGAGCAAQPTWLGKLLRDDSLRTVTVVDLSNAASFDTALEHLQGLSELRWLRLANTQVTDAALVSLQGLSQLQSLDLWNTKVTDAGLVHLQGLIHLRYLDLHNTQVTGSGLVYLQGLSQLQWLDLRNTQVTDSGLVHLRGLSQLRWLALNNTQVTNEGVKELQQALPNCKIEP